MARDDVRKRQNTLATWFRRRWLWGTLLLLFAGRPFAEPLLILFPTVLALWALGSALMTGGVLLAGRADGPWSGISAADSERLQEMRDSWLVAALAAAGLIILGVKTKHLDYWTVEAGMRTFAEIVMSAIYLRFEWRASRRRARNSGAYPARRTSLLAGRLLVQTVTSGLVAVAASFVIPSPAHVPSPERVGSGPVREPSSSAPSTDPRPERPTPSPSASPPVRIVTANEHCRYDVEVALHEAVPPEIGDALWKVWRRAGALTIGCPDSGTISQGSRYFVPLFRGAISHAALFSNEAGSAEVVFPPLSELARHEFMRANLAEVGPRTSTGLGDMQYLRSEHDGCYLALRRTYARDEWGPLVLSSPVTELLVQSSNARGRFPYVMEVSDLQASAVSYVIGFEGVPTRIHIELDTLSGVARAQEDRLESHLPSTCPDLRTFSGLADQLREAQRPHRAAV